VVPVLPPPPVVFVGVLFVVVGCDELVVGGWVTGAGEEFVVGEGAGLEVVIAAPPLLELPLLELPELLEPLLAVVAVLVVFFLAGLCCFFLFGSAFLVVAVVGVVAAAFVVELECEAAPPQPATANAITIVGSAFLIRRVPPRYGVDGPGYKRLVP
jgi:hypothetical protein